MRARADILIEGAAELATPLGRGPLGGAAMGKVLRIPDGAMAISGDRVLWAGSSRDARQHVDIGPGGMVIDASGKLVVPGLVDCHTHLVFAGSRAGELALKLKGVPYLQILAAGGGILSTVRATREAGREELVRLALERLDTMMLHGTTTVEAKSGYGLRPEDELKILAAAAEAGRAHPVDVVNTFMGAHAIPPEFAGRPGEYVSLVVGEMIAQVRDSGLAEFCDVFCEEGVFSAAQARDILAAGLESGLVPKIHADEIHQTGGAELAAELGAVSADHLLNASEEGLAAMVERGVVAVLLPSTSFCLMAGKYADARRMMEMGLPIALATDFNPGSSPNPSMQFTATLACYAMRLTPEEILAGCTINAACALGRGHELGTLEPGKRADVVILDVPDLESWVYHVGVNRVSTVIKSGRVVVDDGRVVRG